MRIHPRYFNQFIVVVAFVAVIIIIFVTIYYQESREERFRQEMAEEGALNSISFFHFNERDSLRISEFNGNFLLVDFWATWSNPSLESHTHLKKLRSDYSDTLDVIAASVRMDSMKVAEYRKAHNYGFEFVDGTAFYDKMKMPGIPSQILLNPQGRVIGTFLGYTDSTRYDSLRTMLQHE